MARIPDAQVPEVNPAGAPGGDFENIRSSPEMFGAFGAKALESLGGGLEKAGNAAIDYATETTNLQNRIHAVSLNTDFADKAGDLLSGFTDKQGRSAIDALPEYRETLRKLREEALANVPSLRERSELAVSLGSLSDRYDAWGTQHADRERKVYEQKTNLDAIGSAVNTAVIGLGQGDRPMFDSETEIAAQTAGANYLKITGDTVGGDLVKAKTRGQAVELGVKHFMDIGDVNAAGALASDYKDSIDAASRVKIEGILAPHLRAQTYEIGANVAEGKMPAPDAFTSAERGAGVPPGYISRTIHIESGGDPNARTGSNVGLGQWGPRELVHYGIKDPRDLTQNANALLAEAEENRPALTKVLGRNPTAAEFYMAHQQGAAGAPALYADPDKTAWQAIRRFYGSDNVAKQAIWGNMTPQMKAMFPGGVDDVKAGQFTGLWAAKYANVTPSGIIDKQAAYQRNDTLFGHDPAMWRGVKSVIDRDVQNQNVEFAERRGQIQAEVPGTIADVREGNIFGPDGAERALPADLDLLGPQAAGRLRAEFASALAEGKAQRAVVFASPAEVAEQRNTLTTGAPPGSEEFRRQDIRSFDTGVDRRNAKLVGKNGDGGEGADPALYTWAHPDVGKAAAARQYTKPETFAAYAQKTLALQEHMGVPSDLQRLMPLSERKNLAERWSNPTTIKADPDDPQQLAGATKAMKEIQTVAYAWGSYWPQVYREIFPHLDPTVRVVAAGMDPDAAKRLLAVQKVPIEKLLESQSTETVSTIRQDSASEMKPFLGSLAGSDRDTTGLDFLAASQKLTALYVKDGLDGGAAAKRAASEIVNSRYDFREGFRVPKFQADGRPTPFTSTEIAMGAVEARSHLGEEGFTLRPGTEEGLTDAARMEATNARARANAVWMTSPNEDGLALVKSNGQPILRTDGTAFILPWSDLVRLGRQAQERVVSYQGAGPQ